MSLPDLNLARRPFRNLRPVARISAALWIAAVILTGITARVYYRSLSGLDQKKRELAELRRATEEEQRAYEEATRRLRTMRLRQQNEHVAFLNRLIAARVFPWSLLFERLGAVLPEGVRVVSLSPLDFSAESRAARAENRAERVFLRISGEARNDGALLELLDRIFADPAFDDPHLVRERTDTGGIEFELELFYLPGAAPADGGGAAAEPAVPRDQGAGADPPEVAASPIGGGAEEAA